jgi:hypothetical protein
MRSMMISNKKRKMLFFNRGCAKEHGPQLTLIGSEADIIDNRHSLIVLWDEFLGGLDLDDVSGIEDG